MLTRVKSAGELACYEYQNVRTETALFSGELADIKSTDDFSTPGYELFNENISFLAHSDKSKIKEPL